MNSKRFIIIIFILVVSAIMGTNTPAFAAQENTKLQHGAAVVVVPPEVKEYWCGNDAGLLGYNMLNAVEKLELALGCKQVTEIPSVVSQKTASIAPVEKAKAPTTDVVAAKTEQGAIAANERTNVAVSRGGSRTITVVATGYTDAPEENYPYAGQPSYIGLPLARGIVAVDPNVIPMGSKLYIEGYGEAIAADQGGAIKGNRIDLFMDSKSEAYAWGMRSVKVTIYN